MVPLDIAALRDARICLLWLVHLVRVRVRVEESVHNLRRVRGMVPAEVSGRRISDVFRG